MNSVKLEGPRVTPVRSVSRAPRSDVLQVNAVSPRRNSKSRESAVVLVNRKIPGKSLSVLDGTTKVTATRAPQSDVLVIDMNSPKAAKAREKPPAKPGVLVTADVMVVTEIDMKATRLSILGNWRAYTPGKIVGILREHYQNMRSLAVMLSRMKTDLKNLEDPPSEKFLSAIALSKKEYNAIRKLNNDVRKRGAMSVHVVSNADDIVMQALSYLTSRDPNLLFCALLVVTGLRPIEIVKMAAFSTKLNNGQGEQSAWYACQTRFAKRGKMTTKYNQCRDRCFLAPYWVIERALDKVRRRWAVKTMSNVDINKKYGSHWGSILIKAFPQWPGLTARLCRRFFAVYAYHYFGTGFFMDGSSQSSLIGFASWNLGHADLEGQAIAYQSLVIRPAPKLKLFQLGKDLGGNLSNLKQIKQ